MKVDEYKTILDSISSLKWRLAKYEAIIKPMEDELDALKQQAMEYLRSVHSDRSKPVNGYYIVLKPSTRVLISDPDALAKWFGKDVDKYKSFDSALVRGAVEKAMAEDGEKVPGVDVVVNEYPTVLKAKDKTNG